MTWEQACEMFARVRRVGATMAEYAAMDAGARGRLKDGPAFVAGSLRGGRRRKGCVEGRSMVCLDADDAGDGLADDWEALADCACACWPTMSSTPDEPRMRLIVPLSRDVTPEEYVPLAQAMAERVGLARFDPTTFQPERLMYLPAACSDAPWALDVREGPLLDPDEWLKGRYHDWRDASEWPVQGVPGAAPGGAATPSDPRERGGVVGAFCRAYDVAGAISAFLGDAYEPAGRGRWTWREGSTRGGLVAYGGGLWCYSNHGTDPTATGHLVNSYDLVRIHRFGQLDGASAPGTRPDLLPSSKAMLKWAAGLPEVRRALAEERAEAVSEALSPLPASADDAIAEIGRRLERRGRGGEVAPTAANAELIMEGDPRIAGRIGSDVRTGTPVLLGDLPWRECARRGERWTDDDDARLRIWLSQAWSFDSRPKTDDQLRASAAARPFDPVREWLEALPRWDGEPRVERLFIDLMGAEDCAYVREVTRKTLCAAVRRALRPGCKFDQMLVLEGAQGLGKSRLLAALGGEWFCDSLTVRDMEDVKVAAEKTSEAWIVEVAELDGMRKASVERVKAWLSSAFDVYRAAYARRAVKRPRRSICVGTVNNLDGYLRDATGNRRFWPVRLTKALAPGQPDGAYVAQLWAEAKALEPGERLWLEGDAAREAEARQRESMESDPRDGLVAEYLAAPVPPEWDRMDAGERRRHLEAVSEWGARIGAGKGCAPRTRVSVPEVLVEALGVERSRATRQDSYQAAAMMRRLGWAPTGAGYRCKAFGKVKEWRPI